MKKLIIYGVEHDWDLEIELFNETEFGMNITIMFEDGHQEQKYNCTEFHHRYNRFTNDIRTAFESDIHSTGGTREIYKMASITIVKAEKKHKTHYNE